MLNTMYFLNIDRAEWLVYTKRPEEESLTTSAERETKQKQTKQERERKASCV